MNRQYYGCDDAPLPDLEGGMPESGIALTPEVVEKALREIYDSKFDPETMIQEDIFRATWQTFNNALDKGLEMSDNTVTDEFKRQLRHNNAVFSAFRTHRMQNDIAHQLLDEDGKLKSFSRFKKDTEHITSHHVNAWLRTEYDTAVIRAHQAADWVRFREEADVLPNLEWIQSTSPTPGLDHRRYWGVTLPVDHPFWSEHRPGDRWNCKCRLEATDREADITAPDEEETGKNDRPAPGLENNPADDGKIFSDRHPYIRNAAEGAEKAVKSVMKDVEKAEKGTEQPRRKEIMPDLKLLKKFKNGGTLHKYDTVEMDKSDYKDLITIGRFFARQGKNVILTPRVHYKSPIYDEIYGALINTKYYRKCPDLSIDGVFYEYESFKKPWKKKKVGTMLKHGLVQSSRVVINNKGGCSDRYIKRLIQIYSNQTDVMEVWIYEKQGIRKL